MLLFDERKLHADNKSFIIFYYKFVILSKNLSNYMWLS